MFALLRVVLGAVLLLYGGAQLATSIWLTTKGVATEGAVSSYVDHGVAYSPVVDYTTQEGRRVRFESRMRPNVGDAIGSGSRAQFVTLYYDPQRPELAVLADAGDMWVLPATLAFLGMLVTAAGVIARLVWGD